MSIQTCTKHQQWINGHNDEMIVVYQANVISFQPCPLCSANSEIEQLKQDIEDLTAERDSLQAQVSDDEEK